MNTFHLNVIPSAQEDTLAIFKREDFIDSFDSPDELTKIRILELPNKGTLKKGNSNIQINQTIFQSDFDNISFKPTKNKNGATFFKWVGNDLPESNAISVKINIEEVNDTPRLNETLIPISTLEDEDFSYIPTVIEPDILEYHIDIHESSTGFTSTIKDHYLSTIKLIHIALKP